MHPPPMPGQMQPQGPPGSLDPGMPGPTDPVAVQRLNEMYMAQRQGVSDRLETDGRGYNSVFSQ